MSEGNRNLSKAARLVKLRELLQTKPWSTQELCRYLKLERRTVQRDLDSLRRSGKVIQDLPGRKYQLTRPGEVRVHFTSVEAKAVYMALRLFALHSSEYNEHYRQAVEKLARATARSAPLISFRRRWRRSFVANSGELDATPGPNRHF